MENDDSGDPSGSVSTNRRWFLGAAGGMGLLGATGLGTSAADFPGYGGIRAQEQAELSDDKINVLFLGDGGHHNPPGLAIELVPYLLDRGIEVLYTERQDDLLLETLHRYDVLLQYGNRSGLTQAQEDSVVEFVENGGGFVPIHSASGTFTDSDAYISLVGGQFLSHGVATMTTERVRPDHPVYDGVPQIEVEEETYRHQNLNDDIEVLAYAAGGDYADDEQEPFTWVRQQGDGRVFYTAWGHFEDEAWKDAGFKKLVENGIRWTSGNEDTIADDTRVLDEPEYSEDTGDIVNWYGGVVDSPPERYDVDGDGSWDLIQDPLPAEESVQHTITPEGFDLDPYLSEEMYPDGVRGQIVDVDFDAQGRAYVAVTQDYPNDVGDGGDAILLCEDTDGDGQADEVTVFQDGLSIPLNLVVYGDGVIVAELEDGHDDGRMVHFEDTDGDGVADEEEELFSGFGTWDTHAGPNQLMYGHDNWIRGQVGYAGFDGEVGGEHHSFASSIFRFKPDGSELEEVAGMSGNLAGLGMTEEGLYFGSCATAGKPSNYAAIPNRYYDAVEGISAPTLESIADSNRILAMTDAVRQGDWHGGYTAASGHTMYTAREYPEKYWNQTGFVSEPTGHLTGVFHLEQDGADYESVYPYNFLGSKDEWVFPLYARVGPDGYAWMIDWYNFIILHNMPFDDVPHGDGNAVTDDHVSGLRDLGYNYSRIYRVTYGDDDDPLPRDLGDASPEELVEALTDDNMFWRLTAQRLLVERGETDIVPDLVDLVTDQSLDEIGLDPGAIHALWTLDGLDVIDETGSTLSHHDPADLDDVPDDVDHVIRCENGDDGLETDVREGVVEALTHESAAVRLNAVRSLPADEQTNEDILTNDLLYDDDERVRMWTMLQLSETPESSDIGEELFYLLRDEVETAFGNDTLVDAATSAAVQHASGFVSTYEEEVDDDDDDEESENLLTNPGFEEVEGGGGSGSGPDGWETMPFSGEGTAEFIYTDEESYDGERSVAITSEEGADAAWQRFGVPVEPETDYTLSAMIKTEDVTTGDPPGWAVDDYDAPYGACLNIEELANGEGLQEEAISDDVTGTEDWTEVTLEFNSMHYEELQINAVFGAYASEATGTAWYDDISVVGPDGEDVFPNGSFESGGLGGGGELSDPDGWEVAFGEDTGTFTYADEESYSGDRSLSIASEEGADAAWDLEAEVSVEPDTDYTLSGMIKTENVETGEPWDGYEDETPIGACLSVQTLAWDGGPNLDAITEGVTGTEDWTEVSVTVNSGDNDTLNVECLFGGFGTATGTAWYDDLSLEGPDGENLLPNASFESGGSDSSDGDETVPVAWEPATWGGSAEYTHTGEVSRSGDYGVEISSTEGIDGSWIQEVEVPPNAQVRFSAYIKTENLENDSADYGVFINSDVDHAGTVGEYLGPGDHDWERVVTTFNTQGNELINVHLTMGGWGTSTGTVWFDDVELVATGGGYGEGAHGVVYGRVQTHLDLTDDDGGTSTDAIEPGTQIEFDGQTGGWVGIDPDAIAGEGNPTLTLLEGETYEIGWTTGDGATHNIAVYDDGDEVVDDLATEFVSDPDDQWLAFEAGSEMATYVCEAHLSTMIGDIEVIQE